MPYRKLNFCKDSLLHIFNRGNDSILIFRDITDYKWFLKKLIYLQLYTKFHVIAYCLMPTHFHFYLKVKEKSDTSKYFQRLQLSYAKYFNRRHYHNGHVFEGPFKSIFVNEESYAIYLCKYIHLNPVKAKLVEKPEYWDFSNYTDVMVRKSNVVDLDFYRCYFTSPRDYADFVNDGETDYEDNIQKYLFD